MAADRNIPTSASSPPVSGPDFMDAVQEELTAIFNTAPFLLNTYGGTANAQTANCSPPIASYVDGMRFVYRPALAPTGAMTLNIDGKGAKSIVDRNGVAIIANLIKVGRSYDLVYNSALGQLVAMDVEQGRIGKQEMWIPATDMITRTTNGAALSSAAESASNKIMTRTMDFDASTIEYVQYSFLAPKRWDEGSMTCKFVWSHTTGATAYVVIWRAQGVAISDNEAIDTAFGAVGQVTDTGGTANRIYITAESTSFVLGNSPSEGDFLTIQFYRLANNAGDTLDVDARLHGVFLYWNAAESGEAY